MTQVERPALPAVPRLVNGAGRLLGRLGVMPVRLDAEALLATARRRTRLDDFGDDDFREGLDRLLASLDAEARLSLLGRFIAREEVCGALCNRLRVLDWHARHPEIAEQPVRRPIVIAGQGRTGTTILHDLLAQDPGSRVPHSWELWSPCPPPEREHAHDDPRIAASQAQLDRSERLIPDFKRIHRMGAELPQECVRITGGDFRSMIFPTQYHVPTYGRWLLYEADLASTYRWHRRYLQHLQSEHPAPRWLLKTPGHIWHLSALLAEYPDAVLIQTHRDPLRVVASVSALTAHLRRMASDHTSVAESAAEFAPYIFEGLDRSMQARDDGVLPLDQVVDVQFLEFLANPIATIDAIYGRLGLELSGEAEDRMRAFLQENPGDGGGESGRYNFAATELDPTELRAQARPYQERFGVTSETVV